MIIRQYQDLIGADAVVAPDDIDFALSAQIKRAIAPFSSVPCIVFPNTQEELAEVITCAYKNRWRVMPVGSGSKLHWGGLTSNIDVIVSTSRLTRLINHAVGDLTFTAEAGMPFKTVYDMLRQSQQQIGIDPAYSDRATLGGIVATGDTGSLRQRFGSVRDMLIGISFVRADGQRVKAGGQVVKNVAGYDLMKLMTGAYGTLGIITQLTFRVYPMAAASQTVVLWGEADAIRAIAATLFTSTLVPTRFDLLSPRLVGALELGKGLGMMVQFQGIEVSVEQQVQALLKLAESASLSRSTCFQHDQESALWKQLREQMENSAIDTPITCKIGVLPNQAVALINHLPELLPVGAIAHIHASSGIGRVRLSGGAIAPQSILRLRSWCQAHGGFLTVLEAPNSWKQQLDVWGAAAATVPIMRSLKQQFDPHGLLNPSRFVGSL